MVNTAHQRVNSDECVTLLLVSSKERILKPLLWALRHFLEKGFRTARTKYQSRSSEDAIVTKDKA